MACLVLSALAANKGSQLLSHEPGTPALLGSGLRPTVFILHMSGGTNLLQASCSNCPEPASGHPASSAQRSLWGSLTECLPGLRKLQREGAAFGQVLEHLGNLVVPAADEALPVDGLDHVAHIDDLDPIYDAPFLDPLQARDRLVGSQHRWRVLGQFSPRSFQEGKMYSDKRA